MRQAAALGATSSKAPAAAPKRKPAPASKPAAPKGGRKKRVVSSESEEDSASFGTADNSEADVSEHEAAGPSKHVYEMEAFSPAVAPKVRIVGAGAGV